MIQRRRPIESAIAERKMFNMGGMAASMPQPTYMDLMQQGIIGMPQQPMGMPQQPQGIMASSQPLVDAIAGDANNPAGGDTLSMAQGGIAKFENGGGARRLPSDFLPPPYAPKAGPRTQIGIGEPPEDMLRRRDTRPSELVNEMFPYSASTGRNFLGPEMMRPGFVGTDPRGEASPIERGAQFIEDFIDQAGRGLSQVSNALGRTMVDIGEGLVTRAPQDVGTATIISQVSAVNDALRRLPQVQGVSDDELGATVKDIAEAATTAQPNISGDELSARIAEGVLSKYEGPVSEGYAMARDDAGRRTVDASPEDGFPAPLGFEMAAEDANRTLVDGVAEGEYQNELNSKVEEYRIAMAESARPDGDPNAQMKFTQDLMANPNYDQSFKNAVLEAGDVGFSEEPAEAPVTGGESTEDAPRPKEKPPIPQGPFDVESEINPDAGPLAETDEKGGIEEPPVRQGPFEAEVEQAANILDTDKKAGPKDIAAFKKEFMEAMPKYEGMSEEEKGFLIAEAGLRVMAGKDPNAITNIAEGLKGLGPALMKGEKEKRAWKRQVELSAAKYALEGVAKEDAKLDALAKEGRVRTTFIVGKTFTDSTGVKRDAGSIYNPTAEEISTDNFQKNILPNLTTEGIYKDKLDNSNALTGITRVGAKHGPSAEGVTKALNSYTDLTKDVRNNAKMLTMLDASIIRNAQGKITGFAPWASAKLNKLRNAARYTKEIKIMDGIDTSTGRGLEQFQYQQQVIANMMLKEILGEGSKNVSNIDRTLASEIVGLLKDFSSITADPVVLNQKLQGIRGVVEQGLQTNLSKMRNSELGFRNVFTAIGPGDTGLVPVSGEMERQRRELLGDIRGVGQRVQDRSREAGRGPVVLKASDYFDFETGTIKKNLPR